MANKPKKPTIDVTPEDFVRAWQTAKSVEDVAAILGCTVNAASQRARQYRRQGVKLRRMPAKPPIEVNRLNELIENLEGKQ